MQNIRYYHLIICLNLLYGIFNSCQSGEKSENTELPGGRALMANLMDLDKTLSNKSDRVYLILPNEGCEGCISTAEYFVKENFNRSHNLKFVFTKITSQKLLRIKLTDSVYNSSNVILDTANAIKYPEVGKSIYPMIVYVENGEVAEIKYQNPESNGVYEIENYLTNTAER